jgi:two-component system phosphate regulon sensor histidine kinase PhoR
MKFRTLVFFNALAVGLALSVLNYYFQQSWMALMVTFLVSFVISFVVFYVLFEKYIYSKIKLIYKLIHNLKLGKDLKDALGEKMSDDPINDVEMEVREWAKSKKLEIDALKDQEKFRREFLSNISHEFKTPLFAIQGYVESLQDGLIYEDPELASQFLDKASKNLDRLNFLLSDLDEISKLESGRIPVNFQKFDLVLLIHEIIEAMEDKGVQYQIELIFKEKYHLPMYVLADREKIRQVFINLIDNSFKYGKVGGQTSIRVYELFEQILIEVTDNGIGIEEKALHRIFERFYRTDKSRSRAVGGSGLGLSIVKHILEAHEQTISVRSTEGLGTTFAFTLQKGRPS